MVLVMKVICEMICSLARRYLTGYSSLLSVGMYTMAASPKTVLSTFKRIVLYIKCRLFSILPDMW